MTALTRYRWLTVLFGSVLLASVALLLEEHYGLGSFVLAASIPLLYLQLTSLKCENCEYRTSLSPAFWLASDVFLFISDSLALGRCPKCKVSLKTAR